jgi:hypothetical protein
MKSDTGNDLNGSFYLYLRSQRKLIFVALAISFVIYIPFKYCFPLPDLFVDSSDYILWATYNFSVAYRPLGYSVFLQLLHFISSAAAFTVFIQFCLFLFSTLFCFFNTDYLFGLPSKFKMLVLLLTICNPILIFQTNLISADSLFCSLTILWLTACLWIIKMPGWWALVLQLLFLYLCFRVRYIAMFFPIVAVVVFIVCSAKIYYRLIGIACTVLVIFLTIQLQKNVTEKETGTPIFSGFAGWQIANNALYCYKHIDINSNDLPSHETQVIDHCVKAYIDSVNNSGGIGDIYLWDRNSPLKKYLNICAHRGHSDYLVAWFISSIPLSDYGWYIIRHYPKEFMQYFILPNTINYFYPNPEALTNYDYKNITLTPETKQWFSLNTDHLDCKFPFLQGKIILVYPAISLLLNVFNILAILFFLSRSIPIWEKIPHDAKGLFIFWCVFYFGYMAFSIFAAAINLRFLDFLFVPGFIMPVILFKSCTSIKSQPI